MTKKYLFTSIIIYFIWLIGYVPAAPEFFLTVTFMMIYIPIWSFNAVGVPWLLESNGNCGWGICSLTLFGWLFLFVFWQGTIYIAIKAFTCAFIKNKQQI
ncbi:hypothetical protein [Psychromonas antarctica]|uniref:hypothetical protein n=1 Tax=Psychromonas antarctica TaxID=67573 RepID=UPI001EE81C4E|nr:hypothetical protein [Psychromonas antarctica]MCG6202983.1 hypothetical protein [Psychromonas antarctica]